MKTSKTHDECKPFLINIEDGTENSITEVRGPGKRCFLKDYLIPCYKDGAKMHFYALACGQCRREFVELARQIHYHGPIEKTGQNN